MLNRMQISVRSGRLAAIESPRGDRLCVRKGRPVQAWDIEIEQADQDTEPPEMMRAISSHLGRLPTGASSPRRCFAP